ncbi:MAG: hypothetical protein IH984_05005 [Planctomycetes bacterium]|nr:hypothetical protein [Planctomycetota bacterium]
MKQVVDPAKNLSALLEKLDKPEQPVETLDPLDTLIESFLMWDSTRVKAKAAYELLMQSVVDYNDLRVSVPGEIAAYMGENYPQAEERAQSIKLVLRDIYLREHEVTLKSLTDKGKREIKKYLRSLDGMVGYVADRVMLLCYSIHCIPADDFLRRALADINACDGSQELPELASWLTRHIKASQAVTTHFALQKWVDEKPGEETSTTRKKTTNKKSPRQTASSSRKST